MPGEIRDQTSEYPRDGLYGVGEVQLTCGDLAGDVYAEASARLNGMEVPGISISLQRRISKGQ